MTNDFQQHLNQITKKAKIKYLDISNRDLAGEADLSEFTVLTSLNSYNNKFENLDFLNTLPNKDKLKKLNFFGNQLKEVDFAQLLNNFPNLESLNIENNPVKTKNLNNLTSQQFSKLVSGIKNKKFRVVSWQGTILMDLLEHAQRLVVRGNTTHNSHMAYLKSLTIKEPSKIAPIQPKTEQTNSKSPNTYLLIGGLVLLLGSVLALGYWLGKRKKPSQFQTF